MSEFLLLFRGGDFEEVQQSPDAMQAHMQQWVKWMNELGEKGKFVGAQPLQAGGRQIQGKKSVVIDGPFVEGKEIVGGYLILKASDIDEATELAKGCPALAHDGNVEIRPIQPMEM